ncbi:hypothetical protein GF377_02420 [candidate division GN15 bacterium]|nr:hypothetical protein [candidate division GN15 bacterium]
MPEWFDFTLNFAIVGLLIVFGVLTLISIAVALIRRADDRWQAHEQAQEEAALEKEPTVDNLTIVLISAAAATMVSGRFHIRRVRRLMPASAAKGSWSAHGRAILHGSHVLPKRGQR